MVDEGDFFEIQEAFARNIVTGFARIEGRTIGIVANQPMVLAGVLDSDAGRKAARFVRFCDCFNIPIVTFVDVPGFLPGTGAGIWRAHQAWRQVAVRLCRGDGAEGHGHHPQGLWRRLCRHGSKHIRGDVNYAWPTAEIAVMGAEGRGRDPLSRGTWRRGQDQDAHQGLSRSASPIPSSRPSAAILDEVIMPHSTRKRVARALNMLRHKKLENPWKKHDNIPL